MNTKRLLGLMSLGTLVFMTGCQNDSDEMGVTSQQSKVIITATMGGDADSRTILGGDDGKKVLWQKEDKLSVFLGNSRNQEFGILTGEGTNYAEFQGEEGLIISGGTSDGSNAMTNVGYYPYSKDITVTKGESGSYTLNVTLPAVQQFVNASFGQEAWPMMAVAESKNDLNFAFKAVATSWKIPMKGKAKIVKAYVNSVANALAGAATVTASNTVAPELKMADGATSTVTLNCGENGIQLTESEATTFVFVIPPGTYATGDLTATFVDDQGKCMAVTTAKDYTIERNEPLNFNERTYSGTENAPTELSMLQAAITAKEASYTLADNVTVGANDEKIVIPAGQTFTLDLNGKTITGSNLDFLDNKGTLNISNGKVSTDATITDGTNRRCIYNRAGAMMTIDGVEFVQTCESWGAAINNAGTMVIEDAKVDSKYWSIWNETTTGNLTIKGGTYTCNSYTESNEKDEGGLSNNPTFSYMIKNTGGATLIIDGGTFNCTHGFAWLDSGSKTTINGGEINHVCQQVITSHTFMITGAETALAVNGCKVKWNSQYNSGGTLVYLLASANAANISIVGGLYDLTGVTNESATNLAVTFVESGDETYPYKAVEVGYKLVGENSYEISNTYGLQYFCDQVNKGNDFEGVTLTLTKDIDLKDTEWAPIGNGTRSGSGFTGNSFKGTFDGGEHTIDGLTITSGEGDAAIGLFGVVNGGTVKNVNFTNANINAAKSELAGAVAGFATGGAVIEKVTVAGEITASEGVGGIVGRVTVSANISNCESSATINATSGNAGGIVGAAYYTTSGNTYTGEEAAVIINECKNTGVVTTSNGGYTGGIVGLSSVSVTNCTNSGSVTAKGTSVGGIVGEQKEAGEVIGCTNSGTVTNNADAYGTGGIVGWVRYPASQVGTGNAFEVQNVIAIKENTNTASVKGGSDAGGIVGTVYNYAIVTKNNNSAEKLDATNFVAGVVGNIQFNSENDMSGEEEYMVEVTYNTSTTLMSKMTGSCKDAYAYDNSQGANTEIEGNTGCTDAPDKGYLKLADGTYNVWNTDGLAVVAAIENATMTLKEGTYELPSTVADGMMITGVEGTVVVPAEGSTSAIPKYYNNATFKNITFKGENRWTYSKGNVVFEQCTFTTSTDEEGYAFHVDEGDGGTIVFNDCEFNGFVAIGANETYTFNRCSFYNNGETGGLSSWGVSYLNNCTFGDDVYIQPKENGQLYFDNVEESYNHRYAGTAAGLMEAINKLTSTSTKIQNITLIDDIDLTNTEWPAMKTTRPFILDGNGYTISNLNVTGSVDDGFDCYAMFNVIGSNATIKDLTISGATVTGNNSANSHGAVLVANIDASTVIEKVKVTKSTVSQCDRSAVLVTYLYFNDDVTVQNCTVEECTVNSIGTAGAILACNNSYSFTATGCVVNNTTITSSEGNNKAGILVGTANGAGVINVVATGSNNKAINNGTETNNALGRNSGTCQTHNISITNE